MKKFIITICAIFIAGFAHADTIDINWHVGDSIYDTSTCTVGGDVILPTAPTKRGYTFNGWKLKYTPIEYLESTGTQYIDTGVTGNNISRIKLNTKWRLNDFDVMAYVSGSFARNAAVPKNSIFGNMVSFNNKYMSNNYCFTDSAAQLARIEVSLGVDYEYELKYENYISSVNINGTTASYSNDTATKSIPLSLYMFRGHDESITGGFKGRIYYWKLELEGALVRDMIPVLDHNGVACLFDKVSRQFFYNAGTGDFIAGPVITE